MIAETVVILTLSSAFSLASPAFEMSPYRLVDDSDANP